MLLTAACASGGWAPPVDELPQPPADTINYHYVASGETLYSIAWRFGTTVDSLKSANGSANQRLSVGQRIRLPNLNASSSQPGRPQSAATNTNFDNSKTENTSDATPVSSGENTEQSVPDMQPTTSSNFNNRQWFWPSQGRVISRFVTNDRRRQGVDIRGEKGDSVLATSTGEVVYAGNAIAGLGNLLIVEHGGGYLSAYAHNDKLLVEEGDRVEGGDEIALMGDTDAPAVQLHFEIRLDGTPVDPLELLPKR